MNNNQVIKEAVLEEMMFLVDQMCNRPYDYFDLTPPEDPESHDDFWDSLEYVVAASVAEVIEEWNSEL